MWIERGPKLGDPPFEEFRFTWYLNDSLIPNQTKESLNLSEVPWILGSLLRCQIFFPSPDGFSLLVRSSPPREWEAGKPMAQNASTIIKENQAALMTPSVSDPNGQKLTVICSAPKSMCGQLQINSQELKLPWSSELSKGTTLSLLARDEDGFLTPFEWKISVNLKPVAMASLKAIYSP
jgi:hypothetical protein